MVNLELNEGIESVADRVGIAERNLLARFKTLEIDLRDSVPVRVPDKAAAHSTMRKAGARYGFDCPALGN